MHLMNGTKAVSVFSSMARTKGVFRAGIWILLWLNLMCLPKAFSESVEWISSTATAPWQIQTNLYLAWNYDDKPFDLVVRLNQRKQRIDGWGGCFNELGWLALQAASPADRQQVLRQLFAPGVGVNFTICRMPIGASDYATNWYSLDDSPGDFDLRHFSLDRDRTILIPYIKAAMGFRPDLKIWGSPWSPPVWMKVNQHYGAGGTNRLIQQENYMSGYARYLSKYVKAYRGEGIPILAVGVQNEPFFGPGYPSCQWTPEELRDFIGVYLGPTFQCEQTGAEIWLATFNNNNLQNYETILSDTRAAQYISAVGVQWAGKDALPELDDKYPNLEFVQTEGECGDGSFDWQAAEYTFGLMKFYLNHGVKVYTSWNMILDTTGKSTWGWKQNALITVNRSSGLVTYTPEFYLFKHIAHFVPAGSVRLDCFGNFDDALAFLTPEQQLILVAVNLHDYPQPITVKMSDRFFEVKLPAKSFNTFQVHGADKLVSRR
jgi:glucosylceramidase